MYPVPQPMEHQQRMELAQLIAEKLITRYGKAVKAIGLYGSLARNEDGPYSDIEMFCVLRTPGETRNYEWCAGPWKAEVNVRDEISLLQEASQVTGSWARTHGKFVHVFPLTDPEDYFSGPRELVMSHSPELFSEVIEEALRLPDLPDGHDREFTKCTSDCFSMRYPVVGVCSLGRRTQLRSRCFSGHSFLSL